MPEIAGARSRAQEQADEFDRSWPSHQGTRIARRAKIPNREALINIQNRQNSVTNNILVRNMIQVYV